MSIAALEVGYYNNRTCLLVVQILRLRSCPLTSCKGYCRRTGRPGNPEALTGTSQALQISGRMLNGALQIPRLRDFLSHNRFGSAYVSP